MIRRFAIGPKQPSYNLSPPLTLLLLGTLIVRREYGIAVDWYGAVPRVPCPSYCSCTVRTLGLSGGFIPWIAAHVGSSSCNSDSSSRSKSNGFRVGNGGVVGNHRLRSTFAFFQTVPTTTTTTEYRSIHCLKRLRFRSSKVWFSSSPPSSHPSPSSPSLPNSSTASPTVMMEPIELSIPCSDGVTLAANYWKPPSSSSSSTNTNPNTNRPVKRILCLHGWLDNAASFHLLAPALVTQLTNHNHHQWDTHVVALDLPGHGRSSHKHPDGPIGVITEYCVYVAEALECLGWTDTSSEPPRSDDGTTDDRPPSNNGVVLIGHSMGTGVAVPYAAAFPSQISSLVLLEGVGPLARSGVDVSMHVRNAVRARLRYGKKQQTGGRSGNGNGNGNGGRVYKSLDQAIQVRIRSAALLPGKQFVSREAATAMVRRSTVAVTNTDDTGIGTDHKTDTSENDWNGPVRFTHDPRLHHPSLHYYTHEQVQCLRNDVQCRVCLLTAKDGWPEPEEPVVGSNGERVPLGVAAVEALEPEVNKVLPGSHHFHADPETVGAVVEEVVGFMERDVK